MRLGRFYIGTIALSVLICFLSGCRKSEPEPAPVESQTDESAAVRQAVINMVTALKDADETKFLASVDATEKEQKALGEIVRLTAAMNKLRDDFIEAYGQKGWDEFQDKSEDLSKDDAHFDFITDESIAKLEEVRIDFRDKKAFYPRENQEKPGRVVKVEGEWLVDGSDFFPSIFGPGVVGTFSGKLADVITQYHTAIGKDGIGPEDIDAELGRAMKALFGITSEKPHLFDIDKL